METTMSKKRDKSLASLVRIYQRQFGPDLDEYLDYYSKLDSLNNAITFACLGKDGKVPNHQRRVGKDKLNQAKRHLLRYAGEIESCQSFDKLLNCVDHRTGGIYRIGILAVYDTSLRLGAFLDIWPEVVYLHAGTKKGCKLLGVDTSEGTVTMDALPKQVRVLKPHHAENFLCIFKDKFAGTGPARDCSPCITG